MPARTSEYLGDIAARLRQMSPRGIADRVFELVREHDTWRRRQCLNLLPAENTTSDGVLQLLGSYISTRATEGFPGDKDRPIRHNAHIDEIEAILIAVSQSLFRAKYVEWRTTSTTMANAVALFALTEPDDVIMSQTMRGGANWNYNAMAIPRLRSLRVEEIPPGEHFGIDVDATRRKAREIRPKFFVLGGSKVLFPYPVRELRAIADEIGARILYDAAHTSLLISAGLFQDPLAEGADIMSTGTHKIMGGPIGGLAVMNDDTVARKMLELTFPPFLQTHDQGHYAATAFAFAEMLEYGGEYARQIVANAKALAVALEGEGFTVLGRERGYTMTHQVIVSLVDEGVSRVTHACEAANILIPMTSLPIGNGEAHRGSRISVMEVTRQGMKEPDMATIAQLIARVALRGDDPLRVAVDVERLVSSFQRLAYAFE